MVLFLLEKNIDSDTFIKKCLDKYLDMSKGINLGDYSKYLSIENFCNDVEINRDKKPYLTYQGERIDIYFNLSHTDGMMALVMGNSECGVDVEKHKDRDYKRIAEKENFKVNSIEEFYDLWTKCEAYLKKEGKGIAYIKNNKNFDFTKVITLNILEGYSLSVIPNDNLIVSILTD